MKCVFSEGRIPIKSWCDPIEESALKQIRNLSNLPFAFKWVSIMPDCHAGYGMPIGGVLATKGVVIPNAVGVDIGCGMCAVKTPLQEVTVEDIKKVMGKIRQAVPVGFNHHKEKQDEALMPNREISNTTIVKKEYQSALCQIGTLGGGNHFIEIQKGSDGYIWVMIHSGSRNIGLKVAKHYNELAEELNEKWFSSVPLENELAYLPIDSDYGQSYLYEMNYCVEFALANRLLMMHNIMDIFNSELSLKNGWGEIINIAHNYAQYEHHYGTDVIIHRKGATLARRGLMGIIPGSQGSSSYIVRGLGNLESFESCSHGAGRNMSRSKAIATLNLAEEIKKMDDQGIIHGMRNQKDLDESASAYKNIDEVMNAQSDLVSIEVKLKPLAVIKG